MHSTRPGSPDSASSSRTASSRSPGGARRFEFNRTPVLGSLEMMSQMELTVDGTDIATAGDRCLLTRRTYRHQTGSVELLALSVWDDQGHLVHFVEFDADALDDTLATLRGCLRSTGRDVHGRRATGDLTGACRRTTPSSTTAAT